MTSKKLGALLRSVPPATARTTPEPVPPVPNEQPRRMPIAKEEPEVPLQVLVPARIREELGILGARERQSLPRTDPARGAQPRHRGERRRGRGKARAAAPPQMNSLIHAIMNS
jgi:hypothetical protein